jgi:hypothetical protein
MRESATTFEQPGRSGTPLAVRSVPRIPVAALGMSLGSFFALTFVLCVLFDLWVPGDKMYAAWLQLLPGFTALNWTSFFVGLGESFLIGWYVALVFAPLFNLIVHIR